MSSGINGTGGLGLGANASAIKNTGQLSDRS